MYFRLRQTYGRYIMSKIYVATSWRNPYQERFVQLLRKEGHEVYDFKHPSPEEKGFSWSDIDPKWQEWSPQQFKDNLDHAIANRGFSRDLIALEQCNSCLLVLPCGISAHLEAGFAAGRNKPTAVYVPELMENEPELMYKLLQHSNSNGYVRADWFCTTIEQVVRFFKDMG